MARPKKATPDHCANGHAWSSDTISIQVCCTECLRQRVANHRERRRAASRQARGNPNVA
jgi:hypothetical protein